MGASYSNVPLPRTPGTVKERCRVILRGHPVHTQRHEPQTTDLCVRGGLATLNRDGIAVAPAAYDLIDMHRQPCDAPDGTADDIIHGWHMIELTDASTGVTHLHLVGNSVRRNRPIMSSRILAYDETARLVRTQSGSTYQLGLSAWNGDPPMKHLLVILSALKSWGMLHVPPV